jgi:CheY-like chemotaxis protein
MVQSSALNLMGIINDLLDFSKIEAGRMTIEEHRFSLNELIDEVCVLMRLRAEQKGLQLIASVARNLPAGVIGDPLRLRQILLNLIGNAVKFTEQGRITLAASAETAVAGKLQIHITVTDTGIGIPVEQQKTIFDPFAQADNSVTRRFGGTGLGLSITRQLTELMGGRVWLESTPGIGSIFHVSLPLTVDSSRPAAAPAAVVKAEVGESGKHALRILVVEDHPVNQKLASRLLEKEGHHVDLACNGQEGVDFSAAHAYDVILMDMQMPVMDGLEATRVIRRREEAQGLPHLPIIAMTANAMESDRQACLDAGMDEFVAKPIRVAELNEKLGQIKAG